MNANIFEAFAKRFASAPDRAALVFPDASVWSFRSLERRASAIACRLRTQGLQPGDRVVAQVEKSGGAVALYLGVLKAGGVYVPLNTAYTPAEVEFFLADAEPKFVFVRPGSPDVLREAARRAGAVDVIELGVDANDAIMHAGASEGPADAAALRGPDDLAAILYTSGTTGRSKGAMLTHCNLLSNAECLVDLWGMNRDDVLLHALPIFHVHGLFVALNTAFLSGARILFLLAFNAKDVRASLREATVMMGVPTFYTRLLEEPDFGREDVRGVRLLISGSAPLAAADFERFRTRTGAEILERYGMTETGMIASNPLTGRRMPGSVGFALPGVDVRICDADGMELPRGETGAIEVRGPNVFPGYWKRPRSDQDFRPNGFFITGDLGVMDPDGRLRIVGRAKDLIISGGYNIYPKEIESVLDAIEGIRESAVIGAPHADLGEGVVAVLTADGPAPDAATVQTALDAQLARFKHPRRFYWEDELPRNAMGKVQKAELRKKYARAFES